VAATFLYRNPTFILWRVRFILRLVLGSLHHYGCVLPLLCSSACV
jgi:hypothetical protein